MSARYNFSIRTTTKYSSTGVSFFTLWLADDDTAKSLANNLNGWLPNNAKISLSKVIQEAPDYELAAGADVTDVAVVSFGLQKRAADGTTTASTTVKIPLPYAKNGTDYVVNHMQELGNKLLQSVESEAGQKFDIIAYTSVAPRNVVSGGAVPA